VLCYRVVVLFFFDVVPTVDMLLCFRCPRYKRCSVLVSEAVSLLDVLGRCAQMRLCMRAYMSPTPHTTHDTRRYTPHPTHHTPHQTPTPHIIWRRIAPTPARPARTHAQTHTQSKPVTTPQAHCTPTHPSPPPHPPPPPPIYPNHCHSITPSLLPGCIHANAQRYVV
jgi:hypothetical protein